MLFILIYFLQIQIIIIYNFKLSTIIFSTFDGFNNYKEGLNIIE